MKQALYYEKKEDKKVRCFLCPHHCLIKDGGVGLCKARKNSDGELYTLNYGRISSAHMDPIEKKPLYHFYPGSWIMSLGTLGCNLSCSFCQNASISQLPKDKYEGYFKAYSKEASVEDIVKLIRDSASKGNIGAAYTYNEPSIWYEFVLECAREINKIGMKNVLVTNGFLEAEPARELFPYIDAANVDIKSINPKFYTKLCGGKLEPVLEYCKIARDSGVLLEVTNLIITGENDSEEDLSNLVGWVAENLGRDTPIHFSRYHPDYEFNAPPTDSRVLAKAYELGIKKLDYVYVGNIWADEWNVTRCPSCHKVIIDRSGFKVRKVALEDKNHCQYCQAEVNIVN
ncbi:MAG: AmmeMemoRadiSam system radical SAM enzyme [Vulcanimicrobiota bacterium]